MQIAAINAEHGKALIAETDPTRRHAIAADALAHAPFPVLHLHDPVSTAAAAQLLNFIAATSPDLAASLIGHPLIHAAPEFPIRAMGPTETKQRAAELAQLSDFDLDHYLENFADLPADQVLKAAMRQAVKHLLADLRQLYTAAAAQTLGILAVAE